MDISKLKHIHFSGIKGVGMTALALYAQDLGIKITGSDVNEEFVTDEILKKRKIQVFTGFHKANVTKQTQLLIYSAARPKNTEVLFAKKVSIPTLSYAQALEKFTKDKDMIAVCGVGGKTTTTAMIATILDECGFNPSFINGVGNIPNLGVPGRYSKGKHIVVEADDYASVPGIDDTPKFLYLNPKIIVVTNIEYDHPDVYSSLEETKKAFKLFFKRLSKNGYLIANIDNSNIQNLIKKISDQENSPNIITYGFSPQADWKMSSVKTWRQTNKCSIDFSGISLNLTLNIPGRFNLANACAALAVCTQLGASQRDSINALNKFQGTKRRFQKVGTIKGVEVWDDYAHHPSEIQATLKAAREWFPGKRLVVIFQPHTYSRTKKLFKDFTNSFSHADEVIITDIYSSAREKKDSSVSGLLLAQKTKENNHNTQYLKTPSMLEYISSSIKKEDVVITLGAGDIYKVAEALINSQ